jgi:outer membrane protein assembly factor BamB
VQARPASWYSLFLFVGWASTSAAEDWTQFRGPNGDSILRDARIPEEWNEQSHVVWKVPLPGRGWSQPVVAKGKIFVTTAECDDEEKPRRGEMGIVPGAADSRNFTYRWKLLCLSAETGAVLWEQVAHEGKPRVRKHRSNTFASETPVTDGELVIAYFGMTGIDCYDFDGKRLWTKDLGVYPMQADWGTGSSPVLYGDAVLVQCDNSKSSFLVALDKRSGDEIWRVTRQEQSNWSTPYLWKNRVRTELVTAGGNRTRSYDPATGDLLWEMKGSGRTSSSPVGSDELLFIDSVERFMGSPGRLAALRAGAAGDVSLKGNEKTNDWIPWTLTLNAYRNTSPLLFENCLYLLEQNQGIVRCYDAGTGKLHYQKRMPDVVGSTASPWAANGKIFCLDEVGCTLVFEPGPEFKPVATNRLDEDLFWASPAFAGNRLILRSMQHLYCIGENPTDTK